MHQLNAAADVYEHVMLDLELTGLAFDSAILQVGLAFFNTTPGLPETIEVVGFHPRFGVPGNDRTDPATEDWWRSTDAALYAELRARAAEGPPLADVLDQMRVLLHERYRPTKVWADHPQFDCAHIERALQRLGRPSLWRYDTVHSSSTLLMLEAEGGAPVAAPPHPGRRPHDAVSDAWQQALDVQAAYRQRAAARR